MYKKLLFIILFTYPCFVLFGQDRDSLIFKTSTFEEFWNRINYSKKVINNNYISIDYGKYNINYNHKDIISKFSDVYGFKIRYGFHRKEIFERKDSIYYLASEGIYLQNVSSHLILKNYISSGKTTDAWGFGFLYSNGFGKGDWMFLHSAALSWIKIDMENYGESPQEQLRYDIFDETFRFGETFNTSIRYYIFQNIGLDLSYEHQLYFVKTLFGKWLAGAGIELIVQRGIDYFAPEISRKLGDYFVIVNWVGKTFISLIFTELQKQKIFFPFEKDKALNYNGFNLNLTIIF